MEHAPTFWENLIRRGVESDELDYKAAQDWHKLSRAGRAKFARHCMAMANTRGGFVVVGVGEDSSGKPALFTGLTETESRSFDPTEVGNFVNRFADPAVDFMLERPVVDGKKYIVFEIRRFANLPHVCASTCEGELLQGVFYIRTSDASSRPAYRASEIHSLIQRSLRNQRELLGRMLRGILYENPQPDASGVSSERFHEENIHSSSFFMKHSLRNRGNTLALWVHPKNYTEGRFSISEIKKSAGNSCGCSSESLFMPPRVLEKAYATNTSWRAFEPGKDLALRQFFQSGAFHFDAAFELKKDRSVSFAVLLKFFAESFGFLARYYAELGLTDELLEFQLDFSGVENVSLSNVPGGRRNDPPFVCRIPEISMRMERSAADFESSPATHADYFFKRLCERFNLPEGRLSGLEEQIWEALK